MAQLGRRQLFGAALGAAALYLVEEKVTMASDGTTAAAPATTEGARLLGTPCQARNVNSGLVLEDRGRSYMVLGNMNENSHMELIFVDTATGEGEVYRAPAGAGAWALQPLPGNRLAVGTFYDGMFMVFDIARREWIKTVKFPGEQYIWTFAIGKDGRVYGGTYPGARLGALDPETYAFEDLGKPSDENEYLRYTSALPDGRIFCQCGFVKPCTFVFDPATKRFTPAPAHLQSATTGVIWNGYFLAGQKAYRMPDLAEVSPSPFPTPDEKNGGWAIDLRLTTPETLVLRQGLRIWRYKAGDSGLTLWATTPARGMGGIFGLTKDGAFAGVRGQDFFVLHPGDKRVDLKRIPGKASPRDTHFLYADDRGRLWGGPTFGQTLFYMDPKTGQTVNTSGISDKGGEVYEVAVIDGVCYAVAYAGGEVIRWDSEKPWNQIGHVNPKTIATVPGYIRPSAGVTVGPDGRLYSGWLAEYGKFGGALAITDPKTGKTEVIESPLGKHGLNGLALADEGKLALLGTTAYGNGMGNEKGVDAAFGVFDLAARRADYTHAFPGATAVTDIVFEPKTGIAAMLVNGDLWLFDVAKRSFIGSGPALPDKVAVLAVREGRLLYGQGTALKSRDLATGAIVTLATLPSPVGRIAIAPTTGTVYVACGEAVYQIEKASA